MGNRRNSALVSVKSIFTRNFQCHQRLTRPWLHQCTICGQLQWQASTIALFTSSLRATRTAYTYAYMSLCLLSSSTVRYCVAILMTAPWQSNLSSAIMLLYVVRRPAKIIENLSGTEGKEERLRTLRAIACRVPCIKLLRAQRTNATERTKRGPEKCEAIL